MKGMTAMATATVEPKTGQKNIWDMTKEDMETAFAQATRQAQQDLHSKGSPYIIGDAKGTYAVYPDGKKVFTPYGNRINEGR
jgi:hypothetical protein